MLAGEATPSVFTGRTPTVDQWKSPGTACSIEADAPEEPPFAGALFIAAASERSLPLCSACASEEGRPEARQEMEEAPLMCRLSCASLTSSGRSGGLAAGARGEGRSDMRTFGQRWFRPSNGQFKFIHTRGTYTLPVLARPTQSMSASRSISESASSVPSAGMPSRITSASCCMDLLICTGA